MNNTGKSGSTGQSVLQVRTVLPADSPALFDLIRGLAEYEHLPHPDAEAQQRLFRDLFSDTPRVSALIAEYDGTPAGYAMYFETYSSFLALPTLYLEDIFVLPRYRRKKVGLRLFTILVQEAITRGCGRMEWVVLDWNTLAIDFYTHLGARHLKEWQTFRLTRDQLLSLSGSL